MGALGAFAKNSLLKADYQLAAALLSLRDEGPGLVSFLFHGLFEDEAEIGRNLVDPQQRTTLSDFRRFLEYFSSNGYAFVGPDEILAGLDPRGRHALITFDDGYKSSFRSLPLLEEFGAPAVFFISTDQAREQRCFWWDVYFREQTSKGLTEKGMAAWRKHLKTLPAAEIERWLVEEFGPDAFKPKGEIDRPATLGELKALAAHELVRIGNHTASHAILPNHDAAEIRRQIAEAQRVLTEVTGSPPVMIAYPNGNASEEVVRISVECGLKLGITVTPGKNRPPFRPMSLRRWLLTAGPDFEAQCRLARSDFSAFGLLKSARSAY